MDDAQWACMVRALVGIVVLAAVGCGGSELPTQSESVALLGDGEDVAAVESATEDVGASLVGGDDMLVAISPDKARFPVACLTADKTSPTSEVLHLRGCGVPVVRGDVVVRWELRGLVLHVELDSKDLAVGTTHVRAASVVAEIVGAGLDRTAFWDAHFEGEARTDTPNPRSFVRDVSKTVRWRVGGACATTDGSSTGSFETKDGAKRRVRVAVTGYRTCGVPCPEPNSRVRVDNMDTGAGVELRYLPGARALLTDMDGRRLPVVPTCAKR